MRKLLAAIGVSLVDVMFVSGFRASSRSGSGPRAIHLQVIDCSASEVVAMIEGAMRHGTSTDVDGRYADSTAVRDRGSASCGFDLLLRIKRINHAKLYRPAACEANPLPSPDTGQDAANPVEDVIEKYDQMIRYATAILSRIASTAAILRRITKVNAIQPTYQPMIETSRAPKT